MDTYGIYGKDMAACVGLERDGKIVSVCGYNSFNSKSCFIHFYTTVKYAPRKYLWFIHFYPFVQCGLKMVIAITGNPAMIKLAEKLGYTPQGFLTDAHPDGGLAIGTLKKEDCRFLNERYAREL